MTSPGDYRGRMRASDEDRARVQYILNDAYAEGRLSQPEWDQRATALASARTYADLDALIADLPHHLQPPLPAPAPPIPAPVLRPAAPTNSMAVGALVSALAQILIGFPAGIAAIILGHLARRQIRETGERGSGMALAGLVMGYVGVLGFLLLVLLIAGVAVGEMGSTVPAPAP